MLLHSGRTTRVEACYSQLDPRAIALMLINGAIGTGTMLRLLKWMEAAMTSHVGVETLLTRVRDWWRRQDELSGLDPKELGRVAADLGMSTNALKDLAARGPDAADLLYERMRALGISRAEVDTLPMASCAISRGHVRAAIRKAFARRTWKSDRMTLCGRAIVRTQSRWTRSRS